MKSALHLNYGNSDRFLSVKDFVDATKASIDLCPATINPDKEAIGLSYKKPFLEVRIIFEHTQNSGMYIIHFTPKGEYTTYQSIASKKITNGESVKVPNIDLSRITFIETFNSALGYHGEFNMSMFNKLESKSLILNKVTLEFHLYGIRRKKDLSFANISSNYKYQMYLEE